MICGAEECDGANLAGQDCTDHGFSDPASLGCDGGTCQYDISGCSATCGDGFIETTEECDGTNLGGQDCTDVGYSDPDTLACDLSCALDTSGCSNTCGDGILEPGETCDDGDSVNENDCTNACEYAYCGDAITWDQGTGTEECDDGDADECNGCTTTCLLNDCGDGVICGTEDCDGAVLGGETCTTLLGADYDGTLACDGFCAFDTSGCYETCSQHSDCTLGLQCDGTQCIEVGDDCNSTPTVITLGGTYTDSGTTENLNDSYDPNGSCGGNPDPTEGPDKVYEISMQAGDWLTAWVIPTNGWDAALHVITDCAASTCAQSWHRANENDRRERVDYVASGAETVYIVVDGDNGGDWGTYDLRVESGTGATAPIAGDIVYTELQPEAASGQEDDCEWLEIYNTSGAPLNLEGTDFNGNTNFTVDQPLIIQPGEFLTLAYNWSPTDNCGVDWVAWAYGVDHLWYNGAVSLSMVNGGTTLDDLSYEGNSGDWPYNSWGVEQYGTSMYLCPGYLDASSNDDWRNWWVDTTSAYGPGDTYGTPGAANPAFCPVWYNASWGYRKRLVIDNQLVPGDLTDFPVLVVLSGDTDVAAGALASGDDLLFALPDGTKLSHEVQYWDGANGDLVAWVRVPDVSSVFDTPFFLYYGNAGAANQENVAGTWSNGYEVVLHLTENGTGADNEYIDSSGNGYHGTGGGVAGSGAANKTPIQLNSGCLIGPTCQEFSDSGDEDLIRIPNTNDGNWTAVTVQAWMWTTDNGDDRIFTKSWGNGGDDIVWHLAKDNDKKCRLRTNDDDREFGGGGGWTDDTWTHFAMTWDAGAGGAVEIYENGASSISDSISGSNLYDYTIEPTIGNSPNEDRGFDGRMQEVRLSYVARSAAWLLTEYYNAADQSNFITVGPEEVP